MNKKLYDYVFWFNPYECIWYAIDRNTEIDFFNGNRNKSEYITDKDINDLIKTINETV